MIFIFYLFFFFQSITTNLFQFFIHTFIRVFFYPNFIKNIKEHTLHDI